MAGLETIVLVGLAGLLGVTYGGVRRFRRPETRSSAYRLFQYGYPMAGACLLLGIALLLLLIGRFEPLNVLGVPIGLGVVRLIAGLLVVLGLLGCMGLLVIVGIGLDLRSESPNVE